MIDITYSKKNNNYSLKTQGHANYNTGNDIVCSAVSTLCYTLIGALDFYSSDKAETKIENGYIDVSVNNANDKTTPLIFEIITLGLGMIEESYGDNVKITINEQEINYDNKQKKYS